MNSLIILLLLAIAAALIALWLHGIWRTDSLQLITQDHQLELAANRDWLSLRLLNYSATGARSGFTSFPYHRDLASLKASHAGTWGFGHERISQITATMAFGPKLMKQLPPLLIEHRWAAPTWILVGPIAMLLLLAIGLIHRRRRGKNRIRRGLCRWCGYDLRGTPDRCPECGQGASQHLQQRNSGTSQAANELPVMCRGRTSRG